MKEEEQYEPRPKPFNDKEEIRRIKREGLRNHGDIPIPWEYWEKRELLFPKKRKSRKELEIHQIKTTEETLIVQKQKIGNKSIAYRCFVPGLIPTEDLPRFGEMYKKLYLAMVYFQFALYRKTGKAYCPHITYPMLLEMAGYNTENKEHINRAKKCVASLAMTVYSIKDEKSGRYEEVSNLISRKTLEGQKGFSYKVNENHTELMKQIYNGNKVRYLNYSPEILKGKHEKKKLKALEYIMELQRLKKHYPTSLRKILVEKAGFTKKEIKEHGGAFPLMNNIAMEAERKNLLDWKIQLRFPRKPSKKKEGEAILEAKTEVIAEVPTEKQGGYPC